MRIFILMAVILLSISYGHTQNIQVDIKPPKDKNIRDILSFQGIELLDIKLSHKELANKKYKITLKSITDGKVSKEIVLIDTDGMPFDNLKIVGDSILELRAFAQKTTDGKVKFRIQSKRFHNTKIVDAFPELDYSLRPTAQDIGNIKLGEKIYLLTYVPPYELAGGGKSWCSVDTGGPNVEAWGDKFNLKHYLIIEIHFS